MKNKNKLVNYIILHNENTAQLFKLLHHTALQKKKKHDTTIINNKTFGYVIKNIDKSYK